MKRDCNKFSRVGDILMTVPLSMPAKVDYNAAISYFVRSAQSTGQYAQILKQVGLTVANLASQKCQLTLIYSMRTQSRLSPVLQPHAARSPLVTRGAREGVLPEGVLLQRLLAVQAVLRRLILVLGT